MFPLQACEGGGRRVRPSTMVLLRGQSKLSSLRPIKSPTVAVAPPTELLRPSVTPLPRPRSLPHVVLDVDVEQAPSPATAQAQAQAQTHAGEEPPPRVVRDVDRRDAHAGVSDVTQLLSLTEQSVMQNTLVRFARDEIYTFVGSVLLAVNPYKYIPSLYGEHAMVAFEQCSLRDAPPHVYALVEGTYRKAIQGGGAQALVISGESGAGKTESTKLALSYPTTTHTQCTRARCIRMPSAN
jgi:myosin heavy subunit